MTSMLHRFDDASGYDQLAEPGQVTTSSAAATVLADNYTGLSFDLPGERL
jgi:hypothetical protein